jgi:ethylmalonyl-CoA mutase
VDEDVHVVGLSILSGTHLSLVPQVVEHLLAEGVVVPGVWPEGLSRRGAGVAAVFTPRTTS